MANETKIAINFAAFLIDITPFLDDYIDLKSS